MSLQPLEDRKLNIQKLKKAIEIRDNSYRLLNWLSDSIANGTVLPTPQRHAGSAEAASQLIANNIYLAPEELLPHPSDAGQFSAFFGTFLTSTFDVVETPGTQGASPLGGCNCEVCMRIVAAPHLQPKKILARDKRRANVLMIDYLDTIVCENGWVPSREALAVIIDLTEQRRNIALLTYCHWLILRLSGECDGPAVLALWRIISRSEKGGILKDFKLSVEAFQAAETKVLAILKEIFDNVT